MLFNMCKECIMQIYMMLVFSLGIKKHVCGWNCFFCIHNSMAPCMHLRLWKSKGDCSPLYLFMLLGTNESAFKFQWLHVSDSTCSFLSSGPPVIVGMSINIASIDSISEVNMVSYKHFRRTIPHWLPTQKTIWFLVWRIQPGWGYYRVSVERGRTLDIFPLNENKYCNVLNYWSLMTSCCLLALCLFPSAWLHLYGDQAQVKTNIYIFFIC